jgi:hypothetical protein
MLHSNIFSDFNKKSVVFEAFRSTVVQSFTLYLLALLKTGRPQPQHIASSLYARMWLRSYLLLAEYLLHFLLPLTDVLLAVFMPWTWRAYITPGDPLAEIASDSNDLQSRCVPYQHRHLKSTVYKLNRSFNLSPSHL